MQKDLSDLVYEQKLNKSLFVNTHGSTIMTTILIVVPKAKLNAIEGFYMTALKDQREKDYESWQKRTLMSIVGSEEIRDYMQEHREKLHDQVDKKDKGEDGLANQATFKSIEEAVSEYGNKRVQQMMAGEEKKHKVEMQQPGAVPMSAKYLEKHDADGNQLWRITCMKSEAVDYIRVMKRAGYPCQAFTFDAQKYIDEQNLIQELGVNLEAQNVRVLNMSFYNFAELFQALMHLKIMRTYIDGVLRFGIPPKFYLGIIHASARQDAKILQKLSDTFAEEHLKEMYGAKEDAQDEDFFPYVSNQLTSPTFLM